jgi:hypothetical protein
MSGEKKKSVYGTALTFQRLVLVNHSKLILYTQETRKFTAFLRHAVQSPFYFPQNAVNNKILSFSVQIIIPRLQLRYMSQS